VKTMENETGDTRQALIEQGSVLYEQWTDKYGPHLRRIPVGEVSHLLGKYLNTMVADLGIEDKGQYLRDLFSRYEAELIEPTRQTIDERAEFEAAAAEFRAERKSRGLSYSMVSFLKGWQARGKNEVILCPSDGHKMSGDLPTSNDERAEFEKWFKSEFCPVHWTDSVSSAAWESWQTRAKLGSPQPSTQTVNANSVKMSPVRFICRHGDFANPCEICQGKGQNTGGSPQSYRGLNPSSDAPQKHGVEGDAE